jgi:Flp pilus assembly protein TadD
MNRRVGGSSRPPATLAIGVLLVILVAGGFWWTTIRPPGGRSSGPSPALGEGSAAAVFVGTAACSPCHEAETTRWRTSMHARAMETPSQTSVEAPFSGETFALHGVTSTFSRRDGRFVARTDGPDGNVQDFDVAYTFGVYPLQQYLLALPGGRFQTLGITWDARPAPAGQRWYHMYPATTLRAGDVEHWTSRSQNWNFMCSECHSTNLRKGYNAAQDAYQTTWSDLSVACEACHGAGSRHVAWAWQRPAGAPVQGGTDTGLTKVGTGDGASWTFNPATGIAHRDRPLPSHAEVEMCARCHSRRAQLTDEYQVGRPLADTHRPSLLEEDLYFADGQIREEVYEYGSFLQSRMYANGVTCSDCHEPHEPELTTKPDAVCERCHQPARFAAPAHHRHASGSAGSSCVACHMPSRTYMTVDDRRDHSFRVPRPDLTVKIGTPNACAACHANRQASWAADQVRSWFGPGRSSAPHYGEALAAGRSAAADAEARLLAVVSDASEPAIVRATAVSLLARWVDPQSGPVIERAANDPDALVRMAAVDVLSTVQEAQRTRILSPRLGDPVRTVRVEAARALASMPGNRIAPSDRARLATGLAEWEQVQRFNADTAGAHVSLGAFYAERGDADRARQEYETARRLEPYFAPAAVNLADLYRLQGRDDAGEKVLREALARTPEVPALHRALGLLMVRRKNMTEALNEIRRAAELAPDDPDAQYTLAVALYSSGRQAAAVDLLDRTWKAHPGDRTVLAALVNYLRERGDFARAEELATRLVDLSKGDPSAQALLDEIRQSRGSRR